MTTDWHAQAVAWIDQVHATLVEAMPDFQLPLPPPITSEADCRAVIEAYLVVMDKVLEAASEATRSSPGASSELETE